MSLRYPKGEQHFPNIRKEGKVYVDKTALIYDLVNNEKYVFLSRPRRFGKSLLLSTIEAYFKGEKHLFDGLQIQFLEKNWEKFPVFHIRLANVDSNNPESLHNNIQLQISQWEKEFDVSPFSSDIASRFSNLIRQTFEKTFKPVVILVDEYDNPLINTLKSEHTETHEKNRELLKSVYSCFKDLDRYIRFGMLTGVSRFSKMSVFSGLNNLTDITFYDRYSSICGFTENEINSQLSEGVTLMADNNEWTYNRTLLELKKAYDGYHFSKKSEDIYNPYSIIRALDKTEIGDYWLETATPSFLAYKLQKSSLSFSKIFDTFAKEATLSESDTSFQSPVALLFQTGYLTIKDYESESKRYKIGIPNREVENGLFPYLLNSFTKLDSTHEDLLIEDMKHFLNEGNINEFLHLLHSFIAGIPTFSGQEKITEKYIEHTLYLIFRCLGFDIKSQVATSYSRMDLMLTTPGFYYIFELKLDGDAEKALRQIENKKYISPFIYDGRKIISVGLNFSSKTRNISEWKINTGN